jgi:hypothetical protein
MRIPIARQTGADIVVSGERVRHGQRTKANQRADTLRAYADVLASAGLDLRFPVKDMAAASAIAEALGPDWPGGSPQLDCVLKGNETPLASGECFAIPDGLLDLYIRPAGVATASEMLAGGSRWDDLIDGVLEAAAEARR